MTVKELKNILSNCPDDYLIGFDITDWNGDFDMPVKDAGIIDEVKVDYTEYDFEIYTDKDKMVILIGTTFYYDCSSGPEKEDL